MSYSTSNPPMKVTAGIGGAPNLWIYKSADAKATVVGAGYITNAVQLGMKVSDFVLVFDTATPGSAIMSVNTLSGNAANLAYTANS